MRIRILLMLFAMTVLFVFFIAKHEAENEKQQDIVQAIADTKPLSRSEQDRIHLMPVELTPQK